MRVTPLLGIVVILCWPDGTRAEGDVVMPPGLTDRSPGELTAEGPILDRLPIAHLAIGPVPESAWHPPWGGTIGPTTGDDHGRTAAYATIDCGRVRPEAEVPNLVRPKALAGRSFGEENWLVVSLLGALVGLGGLAAELARPPKFGLVAYGRARQTSSWIRRPS